MSHLNNIFLKFKNKHYGESCIIFATGPTLNIFDFSLIEEPNIIKIGVNSILYKDDIKLDYYFCGHDASKDNRHLHHINMQKTLKQKIIESKINIQKFCATHVDDNQHPLHFNIDDCKEINALQYGISTNRGVNAFKEDIHLNNLYNHSIIFSALQFALYSGFKKIYLVGCDGGGGFSFLFPNKVWPDDITQCWKEFKQYKEQKHPNIQIISINPKLLKRFFDKDIQNEKL